MISDFKNETFQNFIKNLFPYDDTDYSLWEATKKIKLLFKSIPPLKKPNNTWARNDEKEAILFAKELEDRFTRYNDLRNAHDELEMERFLREEVQNDLPPLRLSLEEVKQVIKTLYPAKAPGYDFITG